MQSKRIIVFRDTLLPFSETFILSQGERLSNFEAIYFGSRKVDGIEVPPDRSYFINNGGIGGRCREILFKVFDNVSASHLDIIKKSRAHLIHAHFGPDGVLAQTLAKAARLPLIITFHGYDATTKDAYAIKSFYKHRKYIKNRQALNQYASKLIVVSNYVKQKIISQGFSENKMVVHYTGIDTDYFQPSPQIDREPVVLFVGRLVEVKGCQYLIKAMKYVQDSFPDVELVVIGDGPLRRHLEAEARKNLKKYRFLGVQPPHIVKWWMNRSKIFSVPSITSENGNTEGFGIVFVEAQAMGVPVVSNFSGGIPEAVSHGETGFLLPEKDWEGLARKICLLLRDKTLWYQFSSCGIERTSKKFDLKKQNELLENIYDDVLNNTKKPL